MAQKSIHPKLQKVRYTFSGGRSIEIPSTYKKSEFLCETDIFIHLAWKATDAKTEDSGSKKVKAFNANFGGISILNSLKPSEAGAPEEEKEVEKAPKAKQEKPAKAVKKEASPKAKK